MFKRNPSGKLLKAAQKGRTQDIEKLLTEGGDPNTFNQWGETALMLAAQGGHTEAARLLLDKGAHVNGKDNSGKTALMHAAQKGRTETAGLLADYGADLNAGDRRGSTPLMWAVLHGHAETVDLLLDKGASPGKINQWGHTALDLAKMNRRADIAALLTKKRNPPPPPPKRYPESDRWTKLGPENIAHAHVDAATQEKLTETFNFASRERTVTRENLQTRHKVTAPPESFDDIDKSALWNALHHFRHQGGKADEDRVFGKKKPPAPKRP